MLKLRRLSYDNNTIRLMRHTALMTRHAGAEMQRYYDLLFHDDIIIASQEFRPKANRFTENRRYFLPRFSAGSFSCAIILAPQASERRQTPASRIIIRSTNTWAVIVVRPAVIPHDIYASLYIMTIHICDVVIRPPSPKLHFSSQLCAAVAAAHEDDASRRDYYFYEYISI